MKKIFYLILTLPILAVSCDKEKEPAAGTMKGVFYADIPGEKDPFELAPDASKTFSLRACAQGSNVSDAVMNFTFKADPDLVEKFNTAKGTNYQMCPGSAYEFVTNKVMLPRYGKSSTTAKVKVTASGLEDGVDYILPVAIDKATGSDNWEVADTLAAYVLFRKSAFDPFAPGTEGNPYAISTVEDLKAMGSQLIEGSIVYFSLENDIDMSGVTDWTPANAFEPYKKFDFNGNGHTISNFTGTTSLFGGVVGKLHDLEVSNANITNASGPVGIIGAYGGSDDAPVEVSHVYVSGKITNTAAHGTGGLFGIIIDATIDACSADVTIVSTKYDSGGIYGYDNTKGPKHSTVSNCWSAGDISGNRMVGGIAGNAANNSTFSEVVIKNCYSTARVHANFKYGGIAGDAIMGLKGDNATKTPKNHIEKCIAWNVLIQGPAADGAEHYSNGTIVGSTATHNYLADCYRKYGIDFQDNPKNAELGYAVIDQENASPETPLVKGTGTYNYAYYGKAAAQGATLSSVAQTLGWSADIWDFSYSVPCHKNGRKWDYQEPVDPGDSDVSGQLPDFDENVLYAE